LDKDNVVQPDVMWIAPNSRCTENDKYLCGAPDLVVEVLSSGSARRDKVTKFRLYDHAGVHEYWVIDPIAHFIEVFVRLDGQFQLLGVFEAGDVFLSVILKGYEVQVVDLFPQHN
jgi:Uma2 family endonuclease